MNKHLAFVFSGYLSSRVEILHEVGLAYPIVQKTFDEASAILGYDLSFIAEHGPSAKANAASITHPLLLTVAVALWRLYGTLTLLRPSIMAGYGVGEYSALVCAEGLSFKDALTLVEYRGKLLQEACNGRDVARAMIIGFSKDKMNHLCAKVSHSNEIVQVAGVNTETHMLVEGDFLATERLLETAYNNGVKYACMLDNEVLEHSIYLKNAANKLATYLETVNVVIPAIPVVQNFNGTPNLTVAKIKEALVKQMCYPVLWCDIVNYMLNARITNIVECGDGRSLFNFIKQMDKDKEVTINHLSTMHGIKELCANKYLTVMSQA